MEREKNQISNMHLLLFFFLSNLRLKKSSNSKIRYFKSEFLGMVKNYDDGWVWVFKDGGRLRWLWILVFRLIEDEDDG